MCRKQLPVWQEFWTENQAKGFQLLTVAEDAQGPEKPRPYVEQAGATYPALVDRSNLLGEEFGFRAVPNALLINEDGSLYRKLPGFDIRKDDHIEVVKAWLGGRKPTKEPEVRQAAAPVAEAAHLFREGQALYENGDDQKALELWKKARAMDPDNWVIRKQIWAVENPDRFYGGEIDTAWQKELIERGL